MELISLKPSYFGAIRVRLVFLASRAKNLGLPWSRNRIQKGKVIFELTEDGEFWPLNLEFVQISDSKIQVLDRPSGFVSVESLKSSELKSVKEWLIIERSAEQNSAGNSDKPVLRPEGQD